MFEGAGHRRAGRPRVNWRIEERVIALAWSFPCMGLRRIAARVAIAPTTVSRIIREKGLRPYRVQYVQALHPTDYKARRKFCRWMLRKLNHNSKFLYNVLFTDEANFSSTSILNRQNIRIWAPRNPHAMHERFIQGHFSINVWADIVQNIIIGPVFLPAHLTSMRYLAFLRNDLLQHLRQTIPRHHRNNIYFMHDGAPPHFSVRVRAYLSEMFGTRWIGRRLASHL